MNILLLAHYYPPEMGGAGARLHGLARWLAAYGHSVTVVTGFPNYPSGVVPPEYHGQIRSLERLDGVDVVRTWVYASAHRSSARRLANYLSFVGSATLAGLTLGRRYDVVIASSPPLFIGLAGVVLARRMGVPLVFDVRDIWPDVAIEAGELRPGAPLTRGMATLANYLYRAADQITPVTDNKRARLIASGVPPEKLTVVSNGVDLDLVPTQVSRDVRAELGLGDAFVVLYAGLIGVAQGVEIALTAAEQLRDRPDVRFVIVGDGVRREPIEAQARQSGLTNVTFVGRQPKEAIPAFMAAADACLVPLVSSSLEDAVPSKLLEAWAYGKPAILAAGGEAAAIVRRVGGGVVVPPERPEQLADAILDLQRRRAELAQLGHNGHSFVARELDRRMLARQMEDVLHGVLSARRRERAEVLR